jgi:DNA-binding NarL/FixJ family response regulator
MIKIALADDHKLFLNGLTNLLNGFDNVKVIGTANNGKELLDLLKVTHPDLVLVDLNMPVMNGFEAAKAILESTTISTKVVIVSTYADEHIVEKVAQLGIHGYVLKDAEPEDLLYTIEEVHEDRHIINMNNILKQTDPFFEDVFQLKHKLTRREIEVLEMVVKGLSTKEIAKQIFLSPYTVNTHRKNIMKKLNVKSSGELVALVTHQ